MRGCSKAAIGEGQVAPLGPKLAASGKDFEMIISHTFCILLSGVVWMCWTGNNPMPSATDSYLLFQAFRNQHSESDFRHRF